MTQYVIFAAKVSSKGPEFGKSSPGALFLTLLLLGGIIILVASMNKHLRIMRKKFSVDSETQDNNISAGKVELHLDRPELFPHSDSDNQQKKISDSP